MNEGKKIDPASEDPMIEDAGYELLSELAGIDTYDVNLRDHPKAWQALERYAAALASLQMAPEGWKLVPLEPTGKMIGEGGFVKTATTAWEEDVYISDEAARKVYLAMLAVAPLPTEPEGK